MTDHYKDIPIVSADTAKREHLPLKALLRNTDPRQSFSDVLRDMSTVHEEAMPVLSTLAQLALVISMSTAGERTLSLQ